MWGRKRRGHKIYMTGEWERVMPHGRCNSPRVQRRLMIRESILQQRGDEVWNGRFGKS